MRRLLLLFILLLSLYAYGFSQDSAIESKYRWGASLTGVYNFRSGASPHVEYSALNGGKIGTYYVVERKRVRWDAEANFGIANYNLQYTHPLYEQYKIRLKQALYSFHIDIAFSLKAYLNHKSRMDVGTGLFFGTDGMLYHNEINKIITESFFDPGVGRTNHRMILYSDMTGNFTFSNGLFFHFTYQSLQPRYPFFIRLRSNLTFRNNNFKANLLHLIITQIVNSLIVPNIPTRG